MAISIISPLALGASDVPPEQAIMTVADSTGDSRMVLIELRLDGGSYAEDVRVRFEALWRDVLANSPSVPAATLIARHYYRCTLTADQIQSLVAEDISRAQNSDHPRAGLIYRVWPDYVMRAHLDRSVTTVKADAAFRTYGCSGNGVVWAVLDSGIDARHPHFQRHNNLRGVVENFHRDFTVTGAASDPLTDAKGHGTHVAGIIAGEAPTGQKLWLALNEPTDQGLPRWVSRQLAEGTTVRGIAPATKLVSLKVLDDDGNTVSSAILEAIDWVRKVNSDGRDIQIHGVNLSLGSDWPPADCAAGQSPICRELDLLLGTGVAVVVSAGNAGAAGALAGPSSDARGQLSTITDPGNTATAITVGSVHRSNPHTYGVTFDSSKGPTLDGRKKPDLVAPGERITSAATGAMVASIAALAPNRKGALARYREDSGTSMAAAHVSGVLAAFLSARPEFIGQPQLVKQIFMDGATDLGRHEFYQGAGLIDLMRALSNV
jgi:subtilisin family serine protease